ncbi:MAG: hypothetical protein HYV28_05260 [Ignavibacteriales bacterium]|nr:hypothetical protein [Ignavibacteriales bacterium]
MDSQNFSTTQDGFVLPAVLVTGFLIMTLLFGIFTVAAFNYQLDIRRFNKKRAELACYSAVRQHLASAKSSLEEGNARVVCDSLPVELTYGLKGLFLRTTAHATLQGKQYFTRSYFGCELAGPFNNAITFSRPAVIPSVAGNTLVTGDIMINGDRVNRSSAYGIRNSIEKFHFGKVIKNTGIAAKLFSDTLIKRVIYAQPDTSARVFDGDLRVTQAFPDTFRSYIVTGNLILCGNTVYPDKKNPVSFFVSGKVLVEQGTVLDRDIDIYSDSTVEIEKSCMIKNVMFASWKDVIIRDHCYFSSVQIYSLGSIYCSGSVFFYPAIIGMYVPVNTKKVTNSIQFTNCTINGTVMLVCEQAGAGQNRSKIVLDERSRLQGVLYTENNAEIKGVVLGSLYVYNLWFKLEPTEYYNWMINLQVNRPALHAAFISPLGFDSRQKYRVLEESWFY